MGWLDGLWQRVRKRAVAGAAKGALDRVKRAGEAVGEVAEREVERGRASVRMRRERDAQREARRRALFDDDAA